MKNNGNVVLCGQVSSYARPDDPEAGANLRDAVFKRITLRGFIVSDFYPQRLLPIRAELAALVRVAWSRFPRRGPASCPVSPRSAPAAGSPPPESPSPARPTWLR